MLECRLEPKCCRYVLLVVSILILLGSVGTSEASAYYSLTMESQATISSPEVILQNGTVGASTIYTNNTSAKVSVSGYGYDFVDNNDSNVDNSTDRGTHSNFTAQQYGPDLVNDTLTEENMGGSGSLLLYVNSFDGEWNAWTMVGTDPYLDAIDYDSSYVYVSGNLRTVGSFNFTDSGKATETINNVTVQLYAKQSDIGKNIEVKVWVGSNWYSLGDQVTPTSWGWMNWTATTELDTWTKIDGAKIHIKSKAPSGTYYVDCARLEVDYSTPDNHELDLEVQWTSVDYDETNEYLCIYGGTIGSENLTVDVWNGSAWKNLTDLNSGWTNVTVSSYLNSSIFTIRFRDANRTGDITQDSWNIDATLLHVWTVETYDYDYVLRVNNTATAESWEIRLKKYSNSSIGRLQNYTIYFHNSTDGASSQIIIENGLFINQTGPWYDLGNSETIYIAMTAEANSTGTSIVYAYLEIRIPGTTAYMQYLITFEIT